MKKKIVVGISGASGMPAAWCLLRMLKEVPDVESHLVLTKAAELTIGYETEKRVEDFRALADVIYDAGEMGAAIASGSFHTDGMIIVPCSMKTIAGIAGGYTDNLLLRAADCMIKERRRLVLMVRECPFSRIHLRNMEFLAECGAHIMPMMMTFYNRPESIEDMVVHVVSKALERFQIDTGRYKRWAGKKGEV